MQLYLIEILHQTTTWDFILCHCPGCILLKFYIKPQRWTTIRANQPSCILLKFYIKPQPPICVPLLCKVVSYWNSTSNHNSISASARDNWLYLIEILHQTTTKSLSRCDFRSCILLKFYIKPQLPVREQEYCWVVSYWNSTSNHNGQSFNSSISLLYLIEILHQTTTPRRL